MIKLPRNLKIVFLLMLFLISAGAVFAQQAVITELTGKVEVKAPRGNWLAARVNMTLASGTEISTGFKAQAVIKLDRATLYVKQLTRLSIEEIARQQTQIKTGLNIKAGTIEAKVDKDPEKKYSHDFKVRSPVATAAVRGTYIIFDGNELGVTEGAATLFNILGQPTTVFAGTSALTKNGTDLIPDKQLRGLRYRIKTRLTRFLGRTTLGSRVSSFLNDASIVVFYLDWGAVD
ncbi:MAG: FecR domain-containing protein [Spirochaetales bacterium]|nr:FecR domain-containing protein [Spirochaetales bacterium]